MEYEKVRNFAREMRKNPTPAEEFFWSKVRSRKFLGKKFNRQFVIEHEEILGEKRFFIADFHCHDYKLLIELDGEIHKSQVEYDQIRESKLRDMGFTVVRFENKVVLDHWPEVEKTLKEFFTSDRVV